MLVLLFFYELSKYSKEKPLIGASMISLSSPWSYQSTYYKEKHAYVGDYMNFFKKNLCLVIIWTILGHLGKLLEIIIQCLLWSLIRACRDTTELQMGRMIPEIALKIVIWSWNILFVLCLWTTCMQNGGQFMMLINCLLKCERVTLCKRWRWWLAWRVCWLRQC